MSRSSWTRAEWASAIEAPPTRVLETLIAAAGPCDVARVHAPTFEAVRDVELQTRATTSHRFASGKRSAD